MAVYALLLCERFDVAHRHLTEALRLAHARGTRVTDPVVYCHRALVARARGAHRRRARRRRARARGQRGRRTSRAGCCTATLVHCLIEEGALDEADRVLADAGLDGARPGRRVLQRRAGRARAPPARAGRRPRARSTICCSSGGASGRGVARALLVPHHWSADAALAYAALGEHDAAVALADETVEVARELGAPGALGVALRDGRRAAVGRRAARARPSSTCAPPTTRLELARGLLELGLRAGPQGRPRAPARRPGAGRGVRRAGAGRARPRRGWARAAGACPRLQVSGVQALTAQERRDRRARRRTT